MDKVTSIIGWQHSKFGRHDDMDTLGLMNLVVLDSLIHAEVDPSEVDAIFVGVYNNGFTRQDFHAGTVSLIDPAFQNTPAVRVENACATGSAALYAACDFVESGRGEVALVVGVEKMTSVSPVEAGELLLSGSYIPEEESGNKSFAGVFAGIAQEYANRYGDPLSAMASIAAKNHKNGSTNPYAQIQKDLGYEFCNTVSEKNPIVTGTLRRTDCSLISDGAVAAVVSSGNRAVKAPRRIGFRSRSQQNDYLPLSRRDPIEFAGAKRAWFNALKDANIRLDDLSFIETHDCFTIAELLQYEALGLAEPGFGHRVVESGIALSDGKLPVNRSGGLKAKGHPLGATGVSMHVISAMQLAGEANGFQLPTANIGGVFNMGGTAVANYASILESW